VRLALFTPYIPYPPDTGGKIRSYHLLRALAQRFEVDLYVPHHGDLSPTTNLSELRSLCRKIHLLPIYKSWRLRDRLARVAAPAPRSVDYFVTQSSLMTAARLLSDNAYAALLADEICMTPYAELLPEVPRIVLRQKVDYLHHYEMARSRPWGTEKLLDWIEARKLREYERRKMPLYEAAVVCSEQDAAVVQTEAPQSELLVIPNGADLTEFVPSGVQGGPPILLYVGSMYYYPNVDAVKYFFDHIWKAIRELIPEVQLRVVGHSPPPEIRSLGRVSGITVTGSVPDVRPYYAEATVLIVPLRLGGGTRLKIVEAMAMGVPVVSTSVGAEGLDTHPGEDILIADDAVSFTKQTVRLLQNPQLRHRIATGGRLLAKRYDWLTLAQPLVGLVEQLTGLR
jgi:hypothetical protein